MLDFASVSVTTTLDGDVCALGALLTLVSKFRIGTELTCFGFGDKWTRVVFVLVSLIACTICMVIHKLNC
jgi:hypothetical protein